MPGRNQIRERAIVPSEETPRGTERGRWMIKEVCSVLTHSLCSPYLHFEARCLSGNSSFIPMCLCADDKAPGRDQCHHCDGCREE